LPKTTNYIFTKFLKRGMNNAEVKQLQLKLQQLGYFSKTTIANGNFGPATETAVKAFQKANKLDQVGYVGVGTRAALNK
jgi:peptidoglycan hydrolase-like protein with peptidoglycan-binding domain